MNIKNFQAYKLIETDNHLSIVEVNANIIDTSAQPLIIADKEVLADYLIAYLSNREIGKTLKEAHQAAMQYARITKVKH